jgi:uncharacterized membrane protein
MLVSLIMIALGGFLWVSGYHVAALFVGLLGVLALGFVFGAMSADRSPDDTVDHGW